MEPASFGKAKWSSGIEQKSWRLAKWEQEEYLVEANFVAKIVARFHGKDRGEIRGKNCAEIRG